MKKLLISGILLILVGIISLVGKGIPYKKNKDVVNAGPIQASVETTTKVLIPPALGGLSLTAGVLLLVLGIRKSKRA